MATLRFRPCHPNTNCYAINLELQFTTCGGIVESKSNLGADCGYFIKEFLAYYRNVDAAGDGKLFFCR